MSVPRSEYPRPQFVREKWENLNGIWAFAIDNCKNGLHKGFQNKDVCFPMKINVPFCPQSKLSGLEIKDFMTGVWYKRDFEVDASALQGRVFLNFGAVDYIASVYVNGKRVGTHKGGYSSFKFDITSFCNVGTNCLAVFVEDDERSPHIPTGKQSVRYDSYECSYTRTTGIWQTVWLDFSPKNYISNVKYITDPANSTVTILATVVGAGEFSARVMYNGELMAEGKQLTSSGFALLTFPLKECHLWELGEGNLYDVELTFDDDMVQSYFGLRSVSLEDGKFLLNGKVVFQRLVLDQGFYPDGIYTAPTDSDLLQDIKLSMQAGFNGARLHEKVFEERFLYYCDKMGYIVWGEYPDWGVKPGPEHIVAMASEWTEVVERDYNHPAIIGWCPHNECRHMDFVPSVKHLYSLTKALDKTRPCIDTSGYVHVVTDVFDEHLYEQNPAVLSKRYAEMKPNDNICDLVDKSRKWQGEPFFVSEFGGIQWSEEWGGNAWGYGNAPKSLEEFYNRFEGLCNAIMDSPYILGFCYTQLTDVEQEQNGIYKYDRGLKFDMERISKIVKRKAKIEES